MPSESTHQCPLLSTLQGWTLSFEGTDLTEEASIMTAGYPPTPSRNSQTSNYFQIGQNGELGLMPCAHILTDTSTDDVCYVMVEPGTDSVHVVTQQFDNTISGGGQQYRLIDTTNNKLAAIENPAGNRILHSFDYGGGNGATATPGRTGARVMFTDPANSYVFTIDDISGASDSPYRYDWPALTNEQQLINTGLTLDSQILAVDTSADLAFFVTSTALYKVSTTGGSPVAATLMVTPGGMKRIVADETNSQVIVSLTAGGMKVYNHSGTEIQTHSTDPDSFDVDPANSYIYYAAGDALKRIDYDGTDDTSLWAPAAGTARVKLVTFDSTNGYVWVVYDDNTAGTIRRGFGYWDVSGSSFHPIRFVTVFI